MTAPAVVTVAETSDELEANLWADSLRDEGVRAEVLTVGTRDALGGGVLFPGAWFRLLVNGDDLDLAREIITGLGGEARLSRQASGTTDNPMRLVWLLGGVIVLFFAGGLLLKALVG